MFELHVKQWYVVSKIWAQLLWVGGMVMLLITSRVGRMTGLTLCRVPSAPELNREETGWEDGSFVLQYCVVHQVMRELFSRARRLPLSSRAEFPHLCEEIVLCSLVGCVVVHTQGMYLDLHCKLLRFGSKIAFLPRKKGIFNSQNSCCLVFVSRQLKKSF